ncbi:Hint domain-containing protein [Nioella aestuarii]|uniref:Hint domain-containing protein n=1 Tax=Nioella aestuarii TaxID=1662864 RepID=UPI003D7F5679
MTDWTGKSPSGDDSHSQPSHAALPPGTEVLSLAGALPVEALYPGDKVITRDAGAQKLIQIARHEVPKDMLFVAIRKDALGGKPARDLILPAGQRILLRDWRAQALFGTPAARVPLSRLVDGEFIRWTDARPEALLTLHFAQEHILYADGLEVISAPPIPAHA